MVKTAHIPNIVLKMLIQYWLFIMWQEVYAFIHDTLELYIGYIDHVDSM